MGNVLQTSFPNAAVEDQQDEDYVATLDTTPQNNEENETKVNSEDDIDTNYQGKNYPIFIIKVDDKTVGYKISWNAAARYVKKLKRQIIHENLFVFNTSGNRNYYWQRALLYHDTIRSFYLYSRPTDTITSYPKIEHKITIEKVCKL
jgi:hypothetical protein